MKANDAIREAMKRKGATQEVLANKTGKSSQSAISNALANKKGLQSYTLVEMARALGYSLVLVDDLDSKNRIVIDE